MIQGRIIAVALAVSAAGLAAIMNHEGEKLTAYIPVPGDVPTISVGATTYEDGSKVKLGDKITPERSKKLLAYHAGLAAKEVARCAPVPMYQHEFDVYSAFVFNVGGGRAGVKDGFCTLKNGNMPTIRKKLLAYDYAGACSELKKWVNFQGKPLRGLVNLREKQYKMCMGIK